jgi:uncharacterized protein (UPF0218 family)
VAVLLFKAIAVISMAATVAAALGDVVTAYAPLLNAAGLALLAYYHQRHNRQIQSKLGQVEEQHRAVKNVARESTQEIVGAIERSAAAERTDAIKREREHDDGPGPKGTW